MPRKPYKMASSSLIRKEANYILQQCIELPHTVKEILVLVRPHIEADSQLARIDGYTVRRLCNRLVRLEEMTVNKTKRPYKYQTIPDVYMERLAEATHCKLCGAFPRRVDEVWLECRAGCPGRFVPAAWRNHNS